MWKNLRTIKCGAFVTPRLRPSAPRAAQRCVNEQYVLHSRCRRASTLLRAEGRQMSHLSVAWHSRSGAYTQPASRCGTQRATSSTVSIEWRGVRGHPNSFRTGSFRTGVRCLGPLVSNRLLRVQQDSHHRLVFLEHGTVRRRMPSLVLHAARCSVTLHQNSRSLHVSVGRSTVQGRLTILARHGACGSVLLQQKLRDVHVSQNRRPMQRQAFILRLPAAHRRVMLQQESHCLLVSRRDGIA